LAITWNLSEYTPGRRKTKTEEKHYIEWIEVITDGTAYRTFLRRGEPPEAIFKTKSENVKAREYCKVHGLWNTGA
jgi:superoxide reductase